VLEFVVQNHLRLSHPSQVCFVHTPKPRLPVETHPNSTQSPYSEINFVCFVTGWNPGIMLERRVQQICGRKPQAFLPRRRVRRHPSHLQWRLRGDTRFLSLLRVWRRTRHR
jgi:hypothetical protein